MTNPDPSVAPPDRKFTHLVPFSRDDFWLVSHDEDGDALEDDGKAYSLRFLHFSHGTWTQTPFYGGRTYGFAGSQTPAGTELVYLEMYGDVITLRDGAFFRRPVAEVKEAQIPVMYALERVGDREFVAGMRRHVFERTGPQSWRALHTKEMADAPSQDFLGLGGTSERDVYAAGDAGSIWRYDGSSWKALAVPSTERILAICATPDGRIYASGAKGLLLVGGPDGFTEIPQKKTDQNLCSMAFFRGQLYLASRENLYRLREDNVLDWLARPDFKSPNEYGLALKVAGDLLWCLHELELRITEDGRHWTTLAQLPGEPKEVADDGSDSEAPDARPLKKSEVKPLSPAAQKFFLEANGKRNDEARSSKEAARKELEARGYAAHEKALAFDQAFAGIHTETSEEDDALRPDVGVVLGIHCCLSGDCAAAFRSYSPPLGKTEGLSKVTAEAIAWAKELTPIGLVLGGHELAVFMDGAGAVHWYSDILGEWGRMAKNGKAFLEDFAKENGPARRPAKAAKKPAKKAAAKKAPARRK